MVALRTAVGVLALVWFGMGQRAEDGGDMTFFRPPPVPRALEVAAALLVAAALVREAVRLWRRPRRSPARLVAWGAAALLGAYVGFTLRVLSSLTAGANIGGGLLLLASPFVLLPLLATALAGEWRARRERD
jgi:class 3 adenylate cyclase